MVDRKVIIGEPARQYILTNEAPVIVSNKEVAAAMTMNDLDLTNPFPGTFSQMESTVLQEITKTSPSRMDDDQHDLDGENEVLSIILFKKLSSHFETKLNILFFITV